MVTSCSKVKSGANFFTLCVAHRPDKRSNLAGGSAVVRSAKLLFAVVNSVAGANMAAFLRQHSRSKARFAPTHAGRNIFRPNTYINTYICANIQTYKQTYIRIHTYIHTDTHTHTQIHIHIHTHTHTHTHPHPHSTQ